MTRTKALDFSRAIDYSSHRPFTCLCFEKAERLSLSAFLFIVVFFAFSLSARAQVDVVTSYNAVLNTTCSTPNTACSGAASPPSGPVGTPGSALDEPTGYYNAATITATGTYSGATINFEFSDASGGGGVNYFSMICARTDINLLEGSEALPTNQVRAWNCPAWAINRIRVRLSALSSGAVNITMTLTTVAVDPSLVIAASTANVAGASDPCPDTSAIKSTVPVNIVTATTTQLVALSAGKSVYVCSAVLWLVTSATSADTITFEYGTGSSCGTGTTVLSGAYGSGITAAGSAVMINVGSGMTTASGNALCALSAGTTVNIQGYASYVQQ